MTGLPNELYQRCRTTLLRCDEFESHLSLCAVFVTDELRPFRDRLPAATNKSKRVDACLDFLLDHYVSDGRPVLPIFMAALRGRYSPGDALYGELNTLVSELHICLKISSHDQLASASTPIGEQVKSIEGNATVKRPFTDDDLSIPDWVKKIPEPFMKELEEELRMNEIYWQEDCFHIPAWDRSFTATHFSQQAKMFLQLRDATDGFYESLQQIHPGSNRFHKQVGDLLDRVLDQTTQITQLIGVASQHPLGITVEKATAQVIEDAQEVKHVLRQVALKAIGTPDISPCLFHRLTTSISNLSISLDELQKHLQEMGREAQTVYLSLN